MEPETRRFYERAIDKITDTSIRKLLGDLAATEREHYARADELEKQYLTDRRSTQKRRRAPAVRAPDRPARPCRADGRLGLDARAALRGRVRHAQLADAFMVGLAASVGAGISMGFAEALSDDGSLTGRGRPWIRGVVCGLMTTVGGLGHTLPYLVPDFRAATAIATAVVAVELAAISYIRNHYMDTPFLQAALQVVVGGRARVPRGTADRKRLVGPGHRYLSETRRPAGSSKPSCRRPADPAGLKACATHNSG